MYIYIYIYLIFIKDWESMLLSINFNGYIYQP